MNRASRDLSDEYRLTAIRMSGELFTTVTPICCTGCGSRGSAIATRFCTCTCAISRLVPMSKVTAMAKRPSAVEFEEMQSIPSAPLIWCSIGAATVSATVSALAPGNWPVTLITGGAISGYCATGRRAKGTPPRITKTSETTAAKIGRSMKKCEMRTISSAVLGVGLGLARRRVLLVLRRHLLAGAYARNAVDHDAVIGSDAVLDNAQSVVGVAEHDVFRPGDVLVVEHQHVFARLLGPDRDLGQQQ